MIFTRRNTILLCLQLIGLSSQICFSMSPEEFAINASQKIMEDQSVFFHWEYGGAIIMDALYSFRDSFSIDYTHLLDKYLTMFKTDDKSNPYGYKLLHNISIPFDRPVGDGIGLFPINYLNRVQNHPNSSETKSDWIIINKVVNDYILAFPYRLPDGTFSRHEGWSGEQDKNASFVWGDDQFMGLTLVTRVAAYTSDADSLVEFAAKQALQFAQYMMDSNDGLFFHGYNYADGKRSCCKWGRANGWGMMSHIEVLEVLNIFKGRYDPSIMSDLLKVFQAHANGIANVQSSDGRWHQVLDDPDTFLETSATAMFISSLVRGVFGGWLEPKDFGHVIWNGWLGLQKTLLADGSISGICMGTGIETDDAAYNKRPVLYELSGPGLGSVLYAVREVHAYLKVFGSPG